MNELINKKLSEMHNDYDENECLLSKQINNSIEGYHSKLSGMVHDIRNSADYASAIIATGQSEYYGRARAIFKKLIKIQDIRPQSKTFGLWPYYFEENLDDMLAPDYNWSDFIGKTFIDALIKNPDALGDELCGEMKQCLSNAMSCSIKRNVSPDYTNISMMSCMTIITAGEMLNDSRFLKHGKKRLKKAYEYNCFNNSLSEYNSSSYTVLAIEEITRMLTYFKDEECIKMAERLNFLAWELLTDHYNINIGQLSPPQVRAYRNLENGSIDSLLYFGTNGRYGKITQAVSLAMLMLEYKCPPECEAKLEFGQSKWIDQIYYKKNSIRTPDEDQVIIKNIDSPDLIARSYLTKDYCMGSFAVSDLWNQRRTSMVVFGREKPCCLRLRGINKDYDFCSAMVYTAQYKNTMLSHIGFATDRGDFHYILDKVKDGVITTSKLSFIFELGGASEDIKIIREGNRFRYTDINITLDIKEWVYNGKKGEIIFDEDKKTVELICFSGTEQTVDISSLESVYGVFALYTGEGGEITVETDKDYVISHIKDKKLRVKSFLKPVSYDTALNNSEVINEKL